MNNSQHCKVGYKYKKLTKLTYFFKCPISYSNHKSSCNIAIKFNFNICNINFSWVMKDLWEKYKCHVIKNDSKIETTYLFRQLAYIDRSSVVYLLQWA